MSITKSEPFAPLDWTLLAATALIWGSSFLFTSVALDHLRPGAVAFLRLVFGAATLAAFPAARRSVPRSAWPGIAVVGLMWMAVPYLLFSIALQWIDSSLAGMLNGAVPLFTTVIASAVARRLPGWRQQVGLVVGLFGMVVVSMPSAVGARATSLGIGLVLLATLCYGIAVNVMVPIQKRHGALPVIWRAELVALTVLAPLGAVGLRGSSFGWASVISVGALGALGTAAAFAAFTALIGRVGSTRSSVAIYFLPPVAIVLGSLVRHESIGASAVAGTLLILAGAFLVSRAEVRRAAPVLFAKAAGLTAIVLLPALVQAQGLPSSVTIARPELSAVWALPRLTGPIKIDGVSDEAAWKSVPLLPLTVYLPVYGAASTERTEARIAYDSDALYIVVDAWEAHPGGIRASSMIRDDDAPGDFVNILLDTFGDRQNAVTFSTTPGGQRNDWTISNDAQGANALSPAWNGVWELATRRDEKGWHAEFRIPFSTLRFTAVGGRVEFGLGVNRLAAHSNERVTFPAVEPTSPMSLWKPSHMQRVSVEGIQTVHSVRFTPYVVAGIDGRRAPDPAQSPWSRKERSEMGGDLKMALTPNLTLDLTANTDFAETEVDDQRINFTRFALLFPEQRQFFVERSGTFEVKTGDTDILFNSRTVGLTSAGEPVRLLGGARVVGRVTGWDVGIFDAQVDGTAGRASENRGVVRLRHALGSTRTWLGVMATSRAGRDTAQLGLGADGELHLGGDDYVSFAAAGLTGDPVAGQDRGVFPRGALRLVAERRRDRDFWYRVAVATTGARYAPALGYVERADAIRPAVEIGYGRVVSDAGHVLRGSLTSAQVYRNTDGSFDAATSTARLQVELPAGGSGRLSVTRQDDHLQTAFAPTPATTVPAGRYQAASVMLEYAPPNGASAVMGLAVRAGDFYDGSQFSAVVAPEWRASAHFRIAADVEVNEINFSARDQHEWSRLARLRVLTAASPHLSLSAVMQVNSLARIALANLRLRYIVEEGHDLWIVYGQMANLDRDRLAPRAPETARAGLTVKYTRSYGR